MSGNVAKKYPSRVGRKPVQEIGNQGDLAQALNAALKRRGDETLTPKKWQQREYQRRKGGE